MRCIVGYVFRAVSFESNLIAAQCAYRMACGVLHRMMQLLPPAESLNQQCAAQVVGTCEFWDLGPFLRMKR